MVDVILHSALHAQIAAQKERLKPHAPLVQKINRAGASSSVRSSVSSNVAALVGSLVGHLHSLLVGNLISF